jgi:hypothetical protein
LPVDTDIDAFPNDPKESSDSDGDDVGTTSALARLTQCC